MQQFLDRWQSMTSISYIAKALVGAITPVSPEATVPTYNLFDTQLSNDINSTGSINKGLTKFLSENPDAQPFTAFQSTSDTGVTVPSSVAAETWIDENMGIIQSSGGAALLLMPQNINATYNAAVYNEQIAQGLRTKWFPGEELPNGQLEGYLQQLYVNAGNAIVLDKWYPQYEKALNGTTGTERIDLETNWQTTINNYSALNPIWGDYWNEDASTTIGGGKRGQLINNMKKLLASPEAPRTEVADMTRTLISAYEAYESTYGSNQLAGESNTDLTSTWKANLYATVAAHPELTNVVTGLFLSLPSTAPVPAPAPGESMRTKESSRLRAGGRRMTDLDRQRLDERQQRQSSRHRQQTLDQGREVVPGALSSNPHRAGHAAVRRHHRLDDPQEFAGEPGYAFQLRQICRSIRQTGSQRRWGMARLVCRSQ